MSITLTAHQQAWLTAHVETGEFASVEDGVRRLIDERIAERAIAGDDLSWVKPYLSDALDDEANGRVLSLEEHEARNDARLARMA